MEEFVKNQASTMLDSLYIGMVIMALYDICRLFRRIIPHKRLLRDLEDIIFFAIAGFMVFSLVYSRNSGSVRGYIIIGVLMGMYIYYRSFGQFLVKFLGKTISTASNISVCMLIGTSWKVILLAGITIPFITKVL